MNPGAARRKVLIVEDEPAIRNVLYVLLAGLGCDGESAPDSRHALDMLRQESFDAVLLDLRCSELPPQHVFSAIKELRPNLMGRVLVITGEVTDPATLELIERNCLPHVARSRVLEDLWDRLRTLLGLSRAPNPAP